MDNDRSPSGLSENIKDFDLNDIAIDADATMEPTDVNDGIESIDAPMEPLMKPFDIEAAIEMVENGMDPFDDDDNRSITESELMAGAEPNWPTPSSSILRSPSQVPTPRNSPTRADNINVSISEFAKEMEEYEAAKFDEEAMDRVESERDWTSPQKKTRKEKVERTLPPINTNYRADILKRHPSGELVRLYDVSWKKYINSTSPAIPFRPITWNGYSSKKYVDTLYPRYCKRPRSNPALNAYDYMEFEAAVKFRERTHELVSQADFGYLSNLYQSEYPQFDIQKDAVKTTVAPVTANVSYPVLYQVVRRDEKAGVLVLEAKDFFVFIDGREDLRILRLTMHASDILNERTGFDMNQISVSDLIWVHEVEISPAARTVIKRNTIVANMKKAENALIYIKCPSILFNITHFSLVTPATKIRKTLGIVTNYPGENNGTPKKTEIVMENNTSSCSINLDTVPFHYREVPKETLIWVDAREPTTHSCRFSATPIGVEESEILHKKIATIWPIRMEEAPAPTGIHKIEDATLAKIEDRVEGFSSYAENPQTALTQLAHLYNVSCARLADAANNSDDRKWYHIDVTLICATPNIISLYAILENRMFECGYVRGRQVIVLIDGFTRGYHMNIEKSELMTRGRTKDLGFFITSAPKTTAEFYGELRTIGKAEDKTLRVSFRLSDNSEQADPLSAYMIRITDIPLDLDVNGGKTLHQTFSKIIPSNEVDDVSTVDTDSLKFEEAISDEINLETPNRARRTIKLGEQQKIAIRAGLDLKTPALNIQSAYGSGKTLTLAVLAAKASVKQLANRVIFVTAVTNSAVAQAMNTITQIADYRTDMVPLRIVSDSAANEHPTDVDIEKVLENFERTHAMDMTLVQLARLREFLERRKHMLTLKNNRSLADIPIADQEEYKISETRCSAIARSIIQMMLEIRKPNVIGITLSALLNGSDTGGILEPFLAANAERLMIINDESSQTPEPALTALALRFPNATFRFFGDRHQLQPYCRIKKTAFAARCGARGLASVLSEASEVPKVTLAETFRSHPGLNELPNRMFYNGHLISGAAIEDRDHIVEKLNLPHPFNYINIRGESTTLTGGTSLKNEKEARFALRLAARLYRCGVEKNEIALICLYNEQKRFLQTLDPSLNVYTVDSVQGKEFETVILLTTKTTATYNPFMDEPTRTNVAITRARSALFVLGHYRALALIPLWKQIVEFAERKNAYFSEMDAYAFFNL